MSVDKSLTKTEHDSLSFLGNRNAIVMQKRSLIRPHDKGKSALASDPPLPPLPPPHEEIACSKRKRAPAEELDTACTSEIGGPAASSKKSRPTDNVSNENDRKEDVGKEQEEDLLTEAQKEKRVQQRTNRLALATYTALDTTGSLDLSFGAETVDHSKIDRKYNNICENKTPHRAETDKSVIIIDSERRSSKVPNDSSIIILDTPAKNRENDEMDELFKNISSGATPSRNNQSMLNADQQQSASLQFQPTPKFENVAKLNHLSEKETEPGSNQEAGNGEPRAAGGGTENPLREERECEEDKELSNIIEEIDNQPSQTQAKESQILREARSQTSVPHLVYPSEKNPDVHIHQVTGNDQAIVKKLEFDSKNEEDDDDDDDAGRQ